MFANTVKLLTIFDCRISSGSLCSYSYIDSMMWYLAMFLLSLLDRSFCSVSRKKRCLGEDEWFGDDSPCRYSSQFICWSNDPGTQPLHLVVLNKTCPVMAGHSGPWLGPFWS